MKNVYIVKSAPKDIDEKHRELGTKNVYLLKSDEQAINRYSDIVHDFVNEKDGLFLVISEDKTFFLNFRNTLWAWPTWRERTGAARPRNSSGP